MTASRTTLLTLLIASSVAGCRPHDLAWDFRLDAGTRAATRGLQAHIRMDGCAGTRVATYRFPLGGAPPVSPLSLQPGTWGFEIEALDASCAVVGDGCREATLPTSDGSVIVDVTAVAPSNPICPMCNDGSCQLGDAGPP